MLNKTPGFIAATLATLSLTASAGTDAALSSGKTPVTEPAKESSPFDKIWGLATFYKSDTNPVVQKIAFTGRAQFDYSLVDGEGRLPGASRDSDLEDDQFNTRRLRLGLKATVFENITLHVEGDFDPDADEFYQRLTDAYLGWEPSKKFGIKIGRQSMPFTMDGNTSSKELLAMDRSVLTNNIWFTTEYLPGIAVSGDVDNLDYRAGVFSQGELNKEFGEFNAGTTWLATIGYDFAEALSAKKARIGFDYVYNAEAPSSPALFTNRSLGNIGSVNFDYQNGDFGLRTDLAGGQGYLNQADIWGLTVMPYYNISKKLQVVARYTYLQSNGDNGLRLGGYEAETVSGARGDEYQEGYLGLNYYLYGHKLKFQTGVQYASMKDSANDGGKFDGVSLTAGLRISW